MANILNVRKPSIHPVLPSLPGSKLNMAVSRDFRYDSLRFMRNRASMGSGAVCHCEELCWPSERRSNPAGSPRAASQGATIIGRPCYYPSRIMHGIFCALAGGVILGATSIQAFARAWGDPTEGRPLLQVFKASDYQVNATVKACLLYTSPSPRDCS